MRFGTKRPAWTSFVSQLELRRQPPSTAAPFCCPLERAKRPRGLHPGLGPTHCCQGGANEMACVPGTRRMELVGSMGQRDPRWNGIPGAARALEVGTCT